MYLFRTVLGRFLGAESKFSTERQFAFSSIGFVQIIYSVWKFSRISGNPCVKSRTPNNRTWSFAPFAMNAACIFIILPSCWHALNGILTKDNWFDLQIRIQVWAYHLFVGCRCFAVTCDIVPLRLAQTTPYHVSCTIVVGRAYCDRIQNAIYLYDFIRLLQIPVSRICYLKLNNRTNNCYAVGQFVRAVVWFDPVWSCAITKIHLIKR